MIRRPRSHHELYYAQPHERWKSRSVEAVHLPEVEGSVAFRFKSPYVYRNTLRATQSGTCGGARLLTPSTALVVRHFVKPVISDESQMRDCFMALCNSQSEGRCGHGEGAMKCLRCSRPTRLNVSSLDRLNVRSSRKKG